MSLANALFSCLFVWFVVKFFEKDGNHELTRMKKARLLAVRVSVKDRDHEITRINTNKRGENARVP